ncbi:MAG: hypothetical protein P8Y23_16970 [Candidatus Lokiarchaeota archaeon]
MDTGYDYITPDFFNLIFFQQKNIVIFPYLDLKHLHSLEIFTVGYNLIDLDATAIHDIIDLLEHESYNSYSQNPTMFFISNVTQDQLRKIIVVDSIRCIINANENIENFPTNKSNFIYFNKKTKNFLNFNPDGMDFNLETWLIKKSQNQSKIIQFTENFYQIKVPELPRVRISPNLVQKESLDEHSMEYEAIMKSNSQIASEFVQAIHQYRSNKVNSANLELMELYNPRKLYNYLRDHHWEQGIPKEFIQDWVNMKISHYPLSESDHQDFLNLFNKLNISYPNIEFPLKDSESSTPSLDYLDKEFKDEILVNAEVSTGIPPIHDFPLFTQWIFDKLEKIESRLKNQKI